MPFATLTFQVKKTQKVWKLVQGIS
jgi:hypothetical protein